MQLTRRQVARRLGKSVATVRRLEGRVLFPSRDWRGTRHFDDWEVERLREKPELARGYGRSEWFEAHEQAIGTLSGRGQREDLTDPRARAHYEPTNGDVLSRALEMLADRLAVVPAKALVRAGIDEDLFDLIVETLQLLTDRHG